jgi:hypothetical protein
MRAILLGLRKGSRAFPNDAVIIVVSFVGHGFDMNPMTAKLAKALSSTNRLWYELQNDAEKRWKITKQTKLVERMLNEVSTWWGRHGGQLIRQRLQQYPEITSVEITVTEERFPEMFKLLHSVHKQNFLGEVSNVLKRLEKLFKEPPLEFVFSYPRANPGQWYSMGRSFSFGTSATSSDIARYLCKSTCPLAFQGFSFVLSWG